MIRRFAPKFVWLLVLVGVALVAWNRWPDIARLPGLLADPTSQTAFNDWLREDAARQAEYAAFDTYLRERGVAEIVPPWQLTRIDAHYAQRCDLPVFRIPPRGLWPNVVPALRLVRDHVKPAVGEVAVLSSYRTPELNVCARGASRSNHLTFHALDLVTQARRGGSEFYQELCAMQDRAGPGSRMGLGAYFDPNAPNYAGGRFHIDARGYRSWGRSYSSASSPCR